MDNIIHKTPTLRQLWRTFVKKEPVTATELCDEEKLEKIANSVNTNPARSDWSIERKRDRIADLYFTLCFTKRGPWYNPDMLGAFRNITESMDTY